MIVGFRGTLLQPAHIGPIHTYTLRKFGLRQASRDPQPPRVVSGQASHVFRHERNAAGFLAACARVTLADELSASHPDPPGPVEQGSHSLRRKAPALAREGRVPR